MRIDLNHGPQPALESNRSGEANLTTPGSSSASNPLGEDQALLSSAHAQLQSLAAQASQLPEVREERVHALRQAVESGHYHPSPEQIAGAIFAHMTAGPAA